MKELFKQQAVIWRQMKGLHKGACLAILLGLCTGLCLVFLKISLTHWIPLFPEKTFSASETETIEVYLMDAAIPYRMDTDKGILIPSDKASEVKAGLSSMQKKAGVPKGYELFDTNTWIKGEKELQVLEMRALKGQLERDLSTFENIKSASVILDIPPQKNFNASKFQTKASVILTLMPKEHLSISQLRAITNHLAGAVRGLEPHMIAISDTTGKLYKAIDPRGVGDPLQDAYLHDASRLFEEHVEKKVSNLLTHLVGADRFYCTVQAVIDKLTDGVLSLSITVLIDAHLIEKHESTFRGEIERQLISVAKGYGSSDLPVVDWIPFKNHQKAILKKKEPKNKVGLIFTLLFSGAAVMALVLFLRKLHKNKNEDEEVLFKLMTRVDMGKLAESIGNEDPQTIALMLSYLEPQKAEQLIASLSAEVQEQVLFYLSELESGRSK